MEDQEYLLNEEDLMEYLFTNLTLMGYSPRVEELFDLIGIFIDFLFEIGMIDDL
jgi:hypothetical protein